MLQVPYGRAMLTKSSVDLTFRESDGVDYVPGVGKSHAEGDKGGRPQVLYGRALLLSTNHYLITPL